MDRWVQDSQLKVLYPPPAISSLKMVSGVSVQDWSISRQDCEANRAKSVFGYPLTSCLGDPFFSWIPPNSASKPKEPSNLFSTFTQTSGLKRTAKCQPLLSCCGWVKTLCSFFVWQGWCWWMAVSQEVFRDHFFPGDHQTLFPIGKSGPQAAGRAEGFSLLALKYPSLRRKDFTYLLLLLGQQT